MHALFRSRINFLRFFLMDISHFALGIYLLFEPAETFDIYVASCGHIFRDIFAAFVQILVMESLVSKKGKNTAAASRKPQAAKPTATGGQLGPGRSRTDPPQAHHNTWRSVRWRIRLLSLSARHPRLSLRRRANQLIVRRRQAPM